MPSMPTLPIEKMVLSLTPYGESIIRAAFRASDGTSAKLRATKPFRKVDPTGPRANFEASANYVWRMFCFDYVARRPHSCMPVTADFDLCAVIKLEHEQREADGTNGWRGRKDSVDSWRTALDTIIKLAESAMPVTAQAGAMSWRGLV